MVWLNDDGLRVKFGLDEAELRNIGAYSHMGPIHFVEVEVDHSELPLVEDGSVTLNDAFSIPAGAFLEEVEIRFPDELFDSAGDGETVNVGLVNQDGTSAEANALVDAATQAELNAGGTNTEGWVGSAVNTTLDTAKMLTWEVDGEQPTAGRTVIRVRWSIPPKAGDTLAWNKSA